MANVINNNKIIIQEVNNLKIEKSDAKSKKIAII